MQGHQSGSPVPHGENSVPGPDDTSSLRALNEKEVLGGIECIS